MTQEFGFDLSQYGALESADESQFKEITKAQNYPFQIRSKIYFTIFIDSRLQLAKKQFRKRTFSFWKKERTRLQKIEKIKLTENLGKIS